MIGMLDRFNRNAFLYLQRFAPGKRAILQAGACAAVGGGLDADITNCCRSILVQFDDDVAVHASQLLDGGVIEHGHHGDAQVDLQAVYDGHAD